MRERRTPPDCKHTNERNDHITTRKHKHFIRHDAELRLGPRLRLRQDSPGGMRRSPLPSTNPSPAPEDETPWMMPDTQRPTSNEHTTFPVFL